MDSNTVIGFLDADDLLHQAADAAVRAAATEHIFAVSVVRVAELLTGAKVGHHDERTVRPAGYSGGKVGWSLNTSGVTSAVFLYGHPATIGARELARLRRDGFETPDGWPP